MIGNSPVNIHEDGCAITAFCQGMNTVFGKKLTPDVLAHDAALFDSIGEVNWGALCRYVGGVQFDGEENVEDDTKILQYLKAKDKFVILRFPLPRALTHFALCWSKPPLSGDFKIADPWYGDIRWARGQYHSITGARYFSKA